jgi:putative Mg2+ transporter-C (MgtC) family protein
VASLDLICSVDAGIDRMDLQPSPVWSDAMPSDLELLGRLLLAAVLGGAVGGERELHDQPAGLRTHMLLTIGACLFTLVSAYGFGGPTDPSRLAAQIVTGIGFLGGGAIVRQGLTVRGLTTAASIWATASIGVAVGAGRYLLATGATVLVVGTLFGLRVVRNLLRRWSVSREEFVLSTRPNFDIQLIAEVARREGVTIRGLERQETDAGSQIVLLAKLPPRYRPERLLDALAAVEGIQQVEWEH